MKVIFLNIDGVLNTGDNLQVSYELWKLKHPGLEHNQDVALDKLYDGLYMDKYGELFDLRAVKWLHFLLAMSDAKVVISSPWKADRNIKAMWADRKLPGSVHDMTPNINSENPAAEIGMWIQENGEDMESFVIIDGVNKYPPNFEDRIVDLDKNFGLNMQGSMTALSILKEKYVPKSGQSIDFSVGELE